MTGCSALVRQVHGRLGGLWRAPTPHSVGEPETHELTESLSSSDSSGRRLPRALQQMRQMPPP